MDLEGFTFGIQMLISNDNNHNNNKQSRSIEFQQKAFVCKKFLENLIVQITFNLIKGIRKWLLSDCQYQYNMIIMKY